MRVPTGAICAFVGENGAGKTTAMSLVGGFLQPREGAVHILGEEGFDAFRLKGRLGVLPQDAELPLRHSATQFLRHLGRLQGLGRKAAAVEADRVLEVVSLADRGRSRIASLSHGMRRRVAVASALVGDPELVLLDEPLAGLDPSQAGGLRAALGAAAGRRTLIVSSHNLHDLERLCDWVVMIDKGRCVRQGALHEVVHTTRVIRWELASEAPLEALRAALPDHDFRGDNTALEQRAPDGVDLDEASLEVMRILSARGIAVRGVRRGAALEDTFLAEVGSKG